jgi:hypothetical protein
MAIFNSYVSLPEGKLFSVYRVYRVYRVYCWTPDDVAGFCIRSFFISASLGTVFAVQFGSGWAKNVQKSKCVFACDEMCSSHLFTFSSNFQDSVHTMVRNRVQITASGLRKVTRSLHHRVWCRRSKVVKTGLRVNGYLMLPANHGQGLKPNGRGWAECWLVQSCSSAMGRL